jgi:hypothetical protein
MDFIALAFETMVKNAKTLLVAEAIMVSIVIMLIGVLKKVAFNHIHNKEVRKALLGLTNIAFSFGATFVYFLIKGIPFKWYWFGGLATSVACIIIYFLYENFYIRKAFHKIGTFAIDKFAYLAKLVWDKANNESDKSLNVEFKKVTQELNAYAKAEIKSATKKLAKADKELENL